MALAQDQRAMLQLLLERGQSYDDIASLLGGSEADVRRRARAALEELGGTDPDSEVGLTDYLLGQADPIGRADAVRHLQADPTTLALAEELSAKLRLLAPQADLPDLPQPKKRRRAATPAGPATPGGGELAPVAADDGERTAPRAASTPRAGLSTRQSRTIAAIGAVALILLVAVVVIVSGGSDEGSGESTTTQSDAGTVGEEVTTVNLRPANGGDAGGEAIFGLANETQAFVDLRLAGLEPPPEGQTYVIWFLLNEERGYPLAPLTVNESGGFDDRFPIPQSALPVVVQTQSVDIALVDNRKLAGDIQDALQGQEVLLDFSGETVLSGRIPRLQNPPANPDLEAEAQGGGAATP